MDFDRSVSQIHNREKRTHRAKVEALLVLLNVAFILTGCKQTPSEPARTFRIAGQVLDSANGLFVAGVVVQLGPLADTSDAMGNFVFASVPEGQYTITMLSPGYARLDSLITVDSDKMLSIYVHKPALKELVVPQTVGTTWTYEYRTVLFNGPSGISISTYGIHTWQIIASDIQAASMVLQIMDARNDTTHSTRYPYFDSTWVTVDTAYFPINISSDSIYFRAPEIMSTFQVVPRYCLLNTDTLSFKNPDYFDSYTATYVNHVGVVENSMRPGGSNYYTSQALRLNSFTPR